jgi:hypothetical protein
MVKARAKASPLSVGYATFPAKTIPVASQLSQFAILLPGGNSFAMAAAVVMPLDKRSASRE